MSDDEFAAVIGAADQQMAQQLARAQACLDLFEKDCGRRANTALDIRVWADVQVPENLRFRILRRVRTAEVWTAACKRIWNDIPAPLASRSPTGQCIALSLAEAANTTGLSESTILAAIADERIAGMKDILDCWYVDRTHLHHVFPPAPAVRLNPIAAGHSMPLRSCLRWESRPLSGRPATSCDGDASVGGCCREYGPTSKWL